MFLKKQIQILVFKIDNSGTFESLGEVNHFDNLLWPDKFNGYAQFELWAPITEENTEYFKKGNILWCGGDNAAIIEIIKSSVDDDGTKTYNIKGRTLEMFLTTRIVWGTYNRTNKHASTIMYELVDQNCVNPTSTRRKIPFLELATDDQIGSVVPTYQRTGDNIYDALVNLAGESDIGFNVLFRPREQKLIFKVVEGADRTIDQQVNDPVEFSTDLEDILSSSYYLNDQDFKSVAFIQGEEQGTNRKSQIAGDSASRLFERRELYVDARDLRSEIITEGGGIVNLTTTEYNEALVQRGLEKLAECELIETFEVRLRVFGDVQYLFGIDYRKGDKVTIRDKQLNVIVSARITEVEEAFSDEYALTLTLGYSYPTILQKVKQQLT